MKKFTLNAGILTAMMLFSSIAGNTVEASTLAGTPTQQSNQKIMWGSSELTSTQIGRITFLKDTKLYKRDANGTVKFHLNAKKGSMWRVHKITKEGNMNVYDLGGGVRVQQSNLSKYESAPTSLIQKQVKENGAHISWENYQGVTYPQVRRLASKDAEETINKSLKDNATFIVVNTPNTERPREVNVLENKNNRLKVVLIDTEVGGEPLVWKYTMVYDVTTGNIIEEILN